LLIGEVARAEVLEATVWAASGQAFANDEKEPVG
jgi:hypothetical protein